MAATARVVSIVRMAVTVSSATPGPSEVVTASEAQVTLALLDLAISYLRHLEVNQALPAGPARAQVAPVHALLRLQGLNFKEDSVNKSFKRALSGV